jgi:xylan 1,4-beta-xylosidase
MSEYNATYANEPDVTDTIYMGPWLANNIRQCDGLTEMMSYWSLSDVFEEQGVVKTPFYGGYGLIAEDNILKPALNAFAMLHRLGTTRLASESDSMLVTRHKNGSLTVALWNYAAPMGTGASYTPSAPTGPARSFDLSFTHVPLNAHVTLQRLDQNHGNVMKAYDAMNRPAFPSLRQIDELHEASQPSAPETAHLTNGKLHVVVPSQGLVVLEIK